MLVRSLQVLTAGIDGQLHLLSMDWDRGSQTSSSQTCYADHEGYVSYHAAQWASFDSFVTASTTGLPLCLHHRHLGLNSNLNMNFQGTLCTAVCYVECRLGGRTSR